MDAPLLLSRKVFLDLSRKVFLDCCSKEAAYEAAFILAVLLPKFKFQIKIYQSCQFCQQLLLAKVKVMVPSCTFTGGAWSKGRMSDADFYETEEQDEEQFC